MRRAFIVAAMRTAAEAMRSNPARTTLTITGIATGTLGLVAMAALLHGAEQTVSGHLGGGAPDVFYVASRLPMESCKAARTNECPETGRTLTPQDAAQLEGLVAVSGVARHVSSAATVRVRGRSVGRVAIDAYTANFGRIVGVETVAGRLFTGAEERAAARIAVVDQAWARRVFRSASPLGRTVEIDGSPLRVVGIFRRPSAVGEAARGSMSSPGHIIVPLETARRFLPIPAGGTDFAVAPLPGVVQSVAIDDVVSALRGRHRSAVGAPDDFVIVTRRELTAAYRASTRGFAVAALALAAIGLLVGGIGVIAVMTIAVTERTREIGVRVALGATRVAIAWQFLSEATAMTTAGTLAGLAGGWALAVLIRSTTALPAAVPPMALAVAIAGGLVTGVIFGLVPALRAARLRPIDALRHE